MHSHLQDVESLEHITMFLIKKGKAQSLELRSYFQEFFWSILFSAVHSSLGMESFWQMHIALSMVRRYFWSYLRLKLYECVFQSRLAVHSINLFWMCLPVLVSCSFNQLISSYHHYAKIVVTVYLLSGKICLL